MTEALRTHQACDDCGSSDALAIYPEHTYCYSCQTRRNTDVDDETIHRPRETSSDLLRVTYTSLAKRRLTEETCRFWSYGKAEDRSGKTVQVAQFRDSSRNTVAQKLRYPDKSFPWINRKAFTGLYGQWLWRTGGKMVVITEGELDALSVSQVQNNKWPVVSLVDGSGSESKSIKEALDWLETFDKVVLFFDNDEAGRKAVDKAKKLFSPGKCHIAWAPEGFKDASDLLQAGKGPAIIDAIWGAKQYRPDGIVTGSAILKRLKDRPVVTSYAYPETWEKLNWMTGGGIRLGELDTWTSGTGMGKTTIIKALQHHYFHNSDFNQALIHLEEPLEDTAEDLISYEIGKRIGLREEEIDQSWIDEVADRLFSATDAQGYHRFQLYDAFGSLEDDSLYGIIRYLAVACGVKVFWLDHLSILVSDMDQDGDERKRIDSIMHNLKSLTVELGIYIGLISHLRKPSGNGKSFEEGAVPTLDDLRGSGGIKQLSNGVFALSRNQQADNARAKNISTVTVLKCRKTGRTGTADFLEFEQATGRIVPGVDPETLTDDSFNDESGDQDY